MCIACEIELVILCIYFRECITHGHKDHLDAFCIIDSNREIRETA